MTKSPRENMVTSPTSSSGSYDKLLEIKALTKQGHNVLSQGDTLEASELFLAAYHLAKEVGNVGVVQGCSANLGACYVVSGQPKQGLKYLETDETLQDEGVENFADRLYNVGVARHALNDINAATIAYEKALEAYTEINANKLAAECASKLASCYHLQRRLNNAEDVYRQSVKGFRAVQDRDCEALALLSLTGVLTDRQDVEGCAAVLDTLLDVCQELTDVHLQGKIYHDVGLLYVSEKLYPSAGECFEQALKCMQADVRDEDKQLKATVLQNLGAVYNFSEMYKKAIVHHRMAADVYGELHDREAQTQVFGNLALAYTESLCYTEALEAFQHALQAAKDCRNVEAHSRATEGIAAIYFRQQNYAKAVSTYKDALKLSSAAQFSDETLDRIVNKLSEALRLQIVTADVEKEATTANGRGGRPRFSREQRQSLIAKGLEKHEEVEEIPEEIGKSYVRKKKRKKIDDEEEQEEEEDEKVFQQPVVGTQGSRAENELYLASFTHNAKTNPKPTQSNMCALM